VNPKVQVPIIRRPEYTAHLEQVDDLTFGHIEVHARPTRAVIRAIRADIASILDMHGGPLFAMTDQPHGGDYEKWRRFVTLIGFSSHDSPHFLCSTSCADSCRFSTRGESFLG
jgi:hypothetical protein